jgi:hypothetical protein
MPAQLLHDKGTLRLSSDFAVQKGKWYFGFICKHCGAKIYSLDNTTPNKEGRIIVGDGKFKELDSDFI